MTERVYITHIKFVNIQSLENHEIIGGVGLNVIVAPNQTGKSVLFKTSQALVSRSSVKRDEWKDFISGNENAGWVSYRFSDETIATLIVTRTGPIYRYHPDPSNSKYYIDQDEPFSEVIKKMGLLVDIDGRVLNIINQRSIINFIEKSSTGPEIIENAASSPELIALIEANRSEYNAMNLSMTDIVYEVESNRQVIEMLDYRDTTSLEAIMPHFNACVEVLDDLINLQTYVEMIIPSKMVPLDVDIVIDALSAWEVCKTLEEIKNVSSVEKETIEILQEVLDVCDELVKIQLDVENHRNLLNDSIIVLDIIGIASGIVPVDLDEVNKSIKLIDDLELVDQVIQYLMHCENKSVEIKQTDQAIELLDDLWELDQLLDGMVQYSRSIRRAQLISEEVRSIELVVRELGMEVECPIYGRIIHSEDTCVPISEKV